VSKKKDNEELLEENETVLEEELSSEGLDQDFQEQVEKSQEEQLEEALAESADLRDRVLRVAADFENYKKRMDRERTNLLKYAGENIFRQLLPVVDNLERALDQGVVEGVAAAKNLDALLEGVQLTLKSLVGTLEKFEVKPIATVGESFDPTRQEALTMEASDTIPLNHVVAEFEKGYHYKDRLLRAARVIVSSGTQEK
jgi:molecular chaperone GrpE